MMYCSAEGKYRIAKQPKFLWFTVVLPLKTIWLKTMAAAFSLQSSQWLMAAASGSNH